MIRGIAYELLGDRYRLERTIVCALPDDLRVPQPVRLGHVTMIRSLLRIDAGYEWDGPSGPTIDTPSFMRGSLVHDALYDLIKAGLLPKRARAAADRVLYLICREDGMSWLRAQYVWAAVRIGGWTHV